MERALGDELDGLLVVRPGRGHHRLSCFQWALEWCCGLQQRVLGARFLVFRSDGVQAATARARPGVRGAARRQ